MMLTAMEVWIIVGGFYVALVALGCLFEAARWVYDRLDEQRMRQARLRRRRREQARAQAELVEWAMGGR